MQFKHDFESLAKNPVFIFLICQIGEQAKTKQCYDSVIYTLQCTHIFQECDKIVSLSNYKNLGSQYQKLFTLKM